MFILVNPHDDRGSLNARIACKYTRLAKYCMCK